MNASASDDPRYVYTEFELGTQRVVMIEDRQNEHAWVQSTVASSVER